MDKKILYQCALAAMTFTGCVKDVNNLEVEQNEEVSLLRIQTRADDNISEVPDGRLFIMSDKGLCVNIMDTDPSEQTAAMKLEEGNYDLYAIGGQDLSFFDLPSKNDATAKSTITPKEGMPMDDLLLQHQRVNLHGGEDKDVDLTLDRKVIRIDKVTVHDVPKDVTRVEVALYPVYESVCLDGTFPEKTKILTIPLVKDTGKSWKSASAVYSFPPVSKPTLTIRFIQSTNPVNYSYSSDEILQANHKVVIDASYTGPQSSNLMATITSRDWAETPQSISFDFDSDNAIPTPGNAYADYYVVTVDELSKTAVLLRKTQEKDIDSQTKMDTRANAINKPAGLNCDTWRLPTVEECKRFLSDPIVNLIQYGEYYYCLSGAKLKKLKASKTETGSIVLDGPYDTSFDAQVNYRPVIDINY